MTDGVKTSSVLFICGMNAIRSPMAEFLTRDIFGNRIFVQSAGVEAGEPDGFMQAVMAEHGIDLVGHEPLSIEDMEDAYFDVVITLSAQAHHRALDWASDQSLEVEYWPTMDPSTVAGHREKVLDAYREVRDGLEKQIRASFGGK